MPWFLVAQHLPVDAGFRVNILHPVTDQNPRIALVFHLLGQHPLDGFLITATITIVKAAVGGCRGDDRAETPASGGGSRQDVHRQNRL